MLLQYFSDSIRLRLGLTEYHQLFWLEGVDEVGKELVLFIPVNRNVFLIDLIGGHSFWRNVNVLRVTLMLFAQFLDFWWHRSRE